MDARRETGGTGLSGTLRRLNAIDSNLQLIYPKNLHFQFLSEFDFFHFHLNLSFDLGFDFFVDRIPGFVFYIVSWRKQTKKQEVWLESVLTLNRERSSRKNNKRV